MTTKNYMCGKFIIPKGELPPVSRMIVIGDLHGDVGVLVKALKISGLIDKNLSFNNWNNFIKNIKWKGGNTVVIQTGDQVDHLRKNGKKIDYGSSLKIFQLLELLHKEAVLKGGAVYSLLGNHEFMNLFGDDRYVSKNEFLEWGKTVKEGKINREKALKVGKYSNGKLEIGNLAQKLTCTRNIVLKIGDWIFVHAGILPEQLDILMKNEIGTYFDVINSLFREYMFDGKVSQKKKNAIYDGKNSVVWTREYDEPTKKTCNKLEKVLKVMNGKHMVIGHNIVDGIQSNCNGKLWSIDVGMSRSIDGNKIEVLEINNNKNVKILRG